MMLTSRTESPARSIIAMQSIALVNQFFNKKRGKHETFPAASFSPFFRIRRQSLRLISELAFNEDGFDLEVAVENDNVRQIPRSESADLFKAERLRLIP